MEYYLIKMKNRLIIHKHKKLQFSKMVIFNKKIYNIRKYIFDKFILFNNMYLFGVRHFKNNYI